MSIFKKILLYAGMIVSVIVLIVCTAGIIGAWVYNGPITDTILEIVVPITEVVDAAESVTGETGAALDEVSAGLKEAQEQIAGLGAEVADANVAVEAVSALVDQDIEPRITEMKDNIRSVYDTLGIAREAIDAFNAIPFIQAEVPGADGIEQIQSGMEEMAGRVDDVQTTLQDQKEELIEGAVEEIRTPLDELDMRVTETRTSLTEVQQSLKETVESLLYIQDRVGFWVDLVSIVITLVLAWLVLSQVAVFMLCRNTLKQEA